MAVLALTSVHLPGELYRQLSRLFVLCARRALLQLALSRTALGSSARAELLFLDHSSGDLASCKWFPARILFRTIYSAKRCEVSRTAALAPLLYTERSAAAFPQGGTGAATILSAERCWCFHSEPCSPLLPGFPTMYSASCPTIPGAERSSD